MDGVTFDLVGYGMMNQWYDGSAQDFPFTPLTYVASVTGAMFFAFFYP